MPDYVKGGSTKLCAAGKFFKSQKKQGNEFFLGSPTQLYRSDLKRINIYIF